MATTPAKKAAAGDGEKAITKAAKSGAKPGPAKVRAAKEDPADGLGPRVEKASLEVKLKDLVDKVTAATGAKKPHVRSVIEAMLKEMGDALAGSQALNLPGLGKLRVVKQADTPAGTMTLKLRRGPGGGAGKAQTDAGAEPLAEVGEDS